MAPICDFIAGISTKSFELDFANSIFCPLDQNPKAEDQVIIESLFYRAGGHQAIDDHLVRTGSLLLFQNQNGLESMLASGWPEAKEPCLAVDTANNHIYAIGGLNGSIAIGDEAVKTVSRFVYDDTSSPITGYEDTAFNSDGSLNLKRKRYRSMCTFYRSKNAAGSDIDKLLVVGGMADPIDITDAKKWFIDFEVINLSNENVKLRNLSRSGLGIRITSGTLHVISTPNDPGNPADLSESENAFVFGGINGRDLAYPTDAVRAFDVADGTVFTSFMRLLEPRVNPVVEPVVYVNDSIVESGGGEVDCFFVWMGVDRFNLSMNASQTVVNKTAGEIICNDRTKIALTFPPPVGRRRRRRNLLSAVDGDTALVPDSRGGSIQRIEELFGGDNDVLRQIVRYNYANDGKFHRIAFDFLVRFEDAEDVMVAQSVIMEYNDLVVDVLNEQMMNVSRSFYPLFWRDGFGAVKEENTRIRVIISQ